MKRYLIDCGMSVGDKGIAKAEVSIAKDHLSKYTPEVDQLYKDLEKAEQHYVETQRELDVATNNDVDAWFKIQEILKKIEEITGVKASTHITNANIVERYIPDYPMDIECDFCHDVVDSTETIEMDNGSLMCNNCEKEHNL